MILQAPQVRPIQEHVARPANPDSGSSLPVIACHSHYVCLLIEAIIAARGEVLTAEYRLVVEQIMHPNQRWALPLDCRPNVTVRQQQTLILLLCGCSEKEIARQLRVRPSTVHAHIKALFSCFGIHSRSELMALFLRPLVERLIANT